MSKPFNNLQALAGVITELGGTVVPANTFQFDLPLGQVREFIPKVHQLGVGVRKLSERVESNPAKALYEPITMARLELYYRDRGD
jgi:hypothetical protein